MGSNYYPWGPHGERVSPFDVKPNPTPSTPSPPFAAPDFAPPVPLSPVAYHAPSTGEYSGAYAGTYTPYGIARVGNFLVSLAVVGFLWQFFVCLYPLPSLAAGFTAVYTAGILVRYFTPDPAFATNTFLAALIAYAAGVVVLVVATRIEQRLARHAAYRIPRHILRLALFAMMAVFAIERASGIPLLSGLDLTVAGANLARILRTPDYLVAVFVFVVIMHMALWKAAGLRAFWHRRLEALGLMK